jgi:hypothetical protein
MELAELYNEIGDVHMRNRKLERDLISFKMKLADFDMNTL